MLWVEKPHENVPQKSFKAHDVRCVVLLFVFFRLFVCNFFLSKTWYVHVLLFSIGLCTGLRLLLKGRIHFKVVPIPILQRIQKEIVRFCNQRNIFAHASASIGYPDMNSECYLTITKSRRPFSKGKKNILRAFARPIGLCAFSYEDVNYFE